jgi:hypothetical protein
MAIIYADYDAPPPREPEPTRVSRRIVGAAVTPGAAAGAT